MLSQRSFTLAVLMLSVHRLVAQNTETVKSTTSSRRGWRQDTQQGEALTPGEETKVNSERWKNVIGSFLSERQLQQRPTPCKRELVLVQVPSEVGAREGLRLRVEGRHGTQLLFTNSTHVATTSRYLTVLVQTSRPVYTGGQTIELRVVLLRRDLSPYQGPVDVFILDTEGYVLRRWISRFPNIGVVELKLRTPALPKPGWWRVKVVASGQVDYHPFLVTKYFTSRFEVMVEMPFFTLRSEGAVSGKFTSRFLTYKPVFGKANVTVFVKDHWQLPDTYFKQVLTDSVPFITGWQDFRYPLERLVGNSTSDLLHAEVKVEVSVKNIFFEDTFVGYAKTRITAPEVKVELVGSSPVVFKPGMSFSTAVSVSYEDQEPLTRARLSQSTLIVAASVRLTTGTTTTLPQIVVGPQEELGLKERLQEQWFSTNLTRGDMIPLLQTFTHQSAFARYRKDGILQFTLDIPEGAEELEVTATYRDSVSTSSAKVRGVPVHSPKGRYLHLTTSTDTATVGEFAIFQVRANFRMDKFQYMVMAKGVLVHSSTEEVWWAGTEGVTTLSVAVSREMAPRFTLIVLHVAPDAEVLVDTIHVSVSLQHSMKVEVVLNQHKDHSKRTVEATMWAPPGSLIALSCARTPTWRKQQHNRITHTRLLKAALHMEPHPRSVHTVTRASRSGAWTEHLAALSAHNTGWWSLASLHLAGLTVLTDAILLAPPNTGECDHQLGFLECGDGSCYRQSEVCDGRIQCANAADELHCLSVSRDQEQTNDEVFSTNELMEVEYRLKQRSWWRDLFDQQEGSWCLINRHFGHREFEQVELSVPNSPGQWVVEGFATHLQHGFHILPEREYDTTPPLLMRLQATSVCRRGEQISVRVHLYNGSKQTVLVMLVLQGSKDYSFVHVEKDATVNHYNPRLSSGDHHHLISVQGEGFTEVMLPLAVTKQSGSFTVTVHARSQAASDTRTVNVRIQPEGTEVRKHTSVLLDLKNRATVYEFLDLPVDESPEITRSIQRRYVYGSPRASLTLSGDVFGPTQKNIVVNFEKAFSGRILKSTDGLAFNLGTTVWTLHYFRLTNQLDITKAKGAFDFMNVQLAGLLTRYRKGAFKMWHFSEPSVWVTAWVVNVLLAAQLQDWENLVYIEPRLINRAIAFLIDHQAEDGSFHETSHYNITLDYKMSFKGWSAGEGEEAAMVAMTALVTTVLQEAIPTLEGQVHARALTAKQRATRFLERQLDQLWDPYEVAITTYALTLVGSTEKEVAFKMLEAHARTSDNRMHWSREAIVSNVRLRENNQRSFVMPKEPQEWDSSAVEATSYALLVYLIQEGVTPRAEAIMRWLNSVRDWTYAFSSTVDTVVAMRALAEYSYRARLRDLTNLKVDLEATANPGVMHTFSITNLSVSSFHAMEVPRPWGHVYLVAKGSGQAVAQMEVSWGVDLERFLKKPARKYFDLSVSETYHFRNKTLINTQVCARWAAVDVSRTSHAALLEVEVATGYDLYQPHANKFVREAQAADFPQLMDAKTDPSRIFWQFNHIESERFRCFSYQLVRHFPAANLTATRSATIMELFAPEHFETTMINSTSLAALDICEVCGSYQCPYCPYYSGTADLPLLDTRFAALSFILAILGSEILNMVA
ncbi:CD109 antigen [Cherax quadricarinatus]|uniref:CD109 antigen n=1 Tax=Cherax quadricarinatus TaxID=27406 RepID=UPI00387E30F1